MKLISASLLTAPLLSGAVSVGSSHQVDDSNSGISSHFHRRDAVGDFEEFNEIFENAFIVVPETYEVSERVAFINLDMTIKNIKCYDISVGDITIAHDRVDGQSIDVLVDVTKLDLNCELDYTYDYGLLNGDGWLKLTTDDNSAYTKLNFVSDDFNSQPPEGSSVDECYADVEIANMDFEGDFVSEIIEIFQR